MHRVRALEPFTYNSVDYKTGDEFDTVEEMHATVLSHAQKVVIVEEIAQTPMPENRRGRYSRRDMRAKR